MPTVYDGAARRQLQERIAALNPGLQPHWGRMSAGQMIVHCDLHLRHSLGEFLTPVRRLIGRFPLNLMIIYLLPTPKSVPTMDELRDPVVGTFEQDKARLKDSLERLGAVPPGTRMPVHAAFGKIGRHAHGTLAYNHLDHHLRQFGV